MEVLRVKSDCITGLSGFQQAIQHFHSETVTDNFHVVRKMESKTDVAGNVCDWYEIDRHYRTIDKTPALRQAEEKNAANIDYLSMMMDVELPGEETQDEQKI